MEGSDFEDDDVFEGFDDMEGSDFDDDMSGSDIGDPIDIINGQNDGFVANKVARLQHHSDEIALQHNLERDLPVAPQELIRLRNEKRELPVYLETPNDKLIR